MLLILVIKDSLFSRHGGGSIIICSFLISVYFKKVNNFRETGEPKRGWSIPNLSGFHHLDQSSWMSDKDHKLLI